MNVHIKTDQGKTVASLSLSAGLAHNEVKTLVRTFRGGADVIAEGVLYYVKVEMIEVKR